MTKVHLEIETSTPPTTNDVPIWDGTQWVPGAGGGGGGGETNTASNVGASGVGVFDNKTGVDLRFRKIASADSALTVTLNGQKIDLAIDREELTVSMAYIKEIDDVGGTVIYQGLASPGTATSSASWQISKTTFTGDDVSIKFADGNGNFDNIWDNRASLAYS